MKNAESAALSDMPTEELVRVNDRLSALLEQHQVLPTTSLQYRLCEAGRVRMDVRTLKRALRELAENRRPRRGKVQPGPWEPIRNLWVSGDLHRGEAEDAAARHVQLVGELAALVNPIYFDDWIGEVCADLDGARVGNGNVGTSARALGATWEIAATETRSHVRIVGKLDVAIWLTHDTEWLYPDDVGMWRFLMESVATNTKPLIIARKIAPATFPVLKKVGAFGLQYYSILADEGSTEALARASSALAWFHVSSPTLLLRKPIAEKTRAAINAIADVEITESQAAAIRLAREIGLGDADAGGATTLLQWAAHEAIEMPENWLTTNEKWIAYARYSRRGFSEAPLAATKAILDRPATTTKPRENTEGSPEAPVSKEPNKEKVGFGRDTVVSRVPLRLRW